MAKGLLLKMLSTTLFNIGICVVGKSDRMSRIGVKINIVVSELINGGKRGILQNISKKKEKLNSVSHRY